jgi:uncharacterized protein (TIGR00290 family)
MQARHTAAVLWTGGKDSCLALHEAVGLGYKVSFLVTFVPPDAAFRAHPVSFLQKQAEALGLVYRTFEVRPPYRQGYQSAFRLMQEELGISHIITGDIDEVGGNPNWVSSIAKELGMTAVTPLWERGRQSLMESILEQQFRVCFSYVRSPWLGPEWVGTELTEASLGELKRVSAETGMDLCGEQGEYHTLVLDGPVFRDSLHLDGSSIRTETGSSFLEIHKLSTHRKNQDGAAVHSQLLQSTY